MSGAPRDPFARLPQSLRPSVSRALGKARPPAPAPAKPEAPLAAFRRISRQKPADAAFWLEYAAAGLAAGDRKAVRAGLAGARARCRSAAQRRRLAQLYQQAGAPRRALALLRALSRSRPRDAALLKDLGVCEFRAGLRQRAAATLARALRLSPRLSEAAMSLAYVLEARGELREALAVYDRALAGAAASHLPALRRGRDLVRLKIGDRPQIGQNDRKGDRSKISHRKTAD